MGMFSNCCGEPTSMHLPNTQIIVLELSGNPNHAVQVAEAVGVGYQIDNTGTKTSYTINGISYSTTLNIYNFILARILFRTDSLGSSLTFAFSNGIRLLVYSDTGFNGGQIHYPGVQSVLPIGQQSFVQVTIVPDQECNVVVTGSSFSDPNNNGTGYGNSLSFFDTYNTASSYSNGLIAGKLLYIKEQRSIIAGYETDWWDARYACQQTASGGGVRTIFNGWGKINISAAIAYAGSIPSCPYPQT